MGPHTGFTPISLLNWEMGNVVNALGRLVVTIPLRGIVNGNFLGPNTGFTPVSVKWEMGNVVNALDIAWSIASYGRVE